MAKRKYSSQDLVNLGQTPPCAIELEANVLGTLMLFPQSFINVSTILTVDAFYKDEHQEIYKSIVNVYVEKDTCDPPLVVADLDKRGKLQDVGGMLYIAKLTDPIVSDTNVSFWAKTLLDKYILREQIRMGVEQVRAALEPNADATGGIQLVSRNADKLNSVWINRSQADRSGDQVDEMLCDLEKRCENASSGKLSGVKTPLRSMDKLLGGWQKSDLILICARPSQGKTALMLAAAYSAAKSGTPVKIFSLEMSRLQLMYRMLMIASDIDPERIRTGRLSPEDWVKINLIKAEIKSLPIDIDDTPGMTPDYIYGTTKLAVSKGKCGIAFIDYLGLIENYIPGASRNEEIGATTRRIKMLAKSGDIPIVLLAQLSRKVEDRPTKRPMLQDIRDSGEVEAHADIVGFIYRPETYGLCDKSGEPIKGRGQLLIEKHRNGPIKDLFFNYNESMTKIWDDESVPDSEPTPAPF